MKRKGNSMEVIREVGNRNKEKLRKVRRRNSEKERKRKGSMQEIRVKGNKNTRK